MLVSVIVTTKNEEKNIANCLKSIKNQTYKDIEIIVVDNNSDDNTKKIAKKYTKTVYNYPTKKVKVKNPRGAQINFGVRKSAGEIVFFPDADMTFEKNLIKEAVHLLERYDALYVPEVILGKGWFGKVRNFERSFYNETCIDAVRFVKKNMFNKVGGFDEKEIMFGPDDWDFTKRIKQKTNKISITKSFNFHHEEEMSFNKYLRKKRNYNASFQGYMKKWGRKDPDIKRQFGLSYRVFLVFMENGKWKRLLLYPLLTVSMFFLKLNVGANYFLSKRGTQ